MAKSKIIKDLANGTVDTMTALKRAKVLFAELENAELINWINYELAGYPSDVKLPDYRVERGSLKGSYIKGSMAQHMKWTDVSIPLGAMPDDLKNNLLEIEFRESIGALIQLSETNEKGLLEKEFGNLDELDLDVTEKTPDELQNIIQNLCVVIYQDQRVTIGNNNKIKGTQIASVVEE